MFYCEIIFYRFDENKKNYQRRRVGEKRMEDCNFDINKINNIEKCLQ